MYIVRFVRTDGKPNEVYYYQCYKDAKYHYELFVDEDVGIYSMLILEKTFCR